jgi:hypothetical protein
LVITIQGTGFRSLRLSDSDILQDRRGFPTLVKTLEYRIGNILGGRGMEMMKISRGKDKA